MNFSHNLTPHSRILNSFSTVFQRTQHLSSIQHSFVTSNTFSKSKEIQASLKCLGYKDSPQALYCSTVVQILSTKTTPLTVFTHIPIHLHSGQVLTLKLRSLTPLHETPLLSTAPSPPRHRCSFTVSHSFGTAVIHPDLPQLQVKSTRSS